MSSNWFARLDSYDMWSPGYRDGAVYAWVGGTLSVLDPSDGSLSWSVSLTFERSSSMNTSVVLGDNAAVVAESGALYAESYETQSLAWSTGESIISMPAISGGELYALSNNKLWVYDEKKGTKLWSREAPLGVSFKGSPALTDNWAFISSPDRVYAISRADQKQVVVAKQGGEVILDVNGMYVFNAGTIYHYKLLSAATN